MAKKPLPRRTPVARTVAGSGAAPRVSEAEGRLDKFALFGLALPCLLLAIAGTVLAVGHTHDRYDVGFLGFPKKTRASWDSGPEAVTRLTGAPQILGFENHGQLVRGGGNEVDVALLNVGYANNVNLGDVFTLRQEKDGVRLEFVVFDAQENVSRAYILLGQAVEGRQRAHSMDRRSIESLCGGATGIDVQRQWRDQIIRRYAEKRGTAG
jgi:hypothetical protein